MATGRPKKEIDKKIFENLWLLGVQKDGYLYVFDCSSEELDTFCVDTYGLDFESLKKEIEYAKHPNKDKDYPYTVYMHIAPNGKKYIGITKCSLAKRWANGKGYWSNSHFTKAIQNYGWDNIQHAILYMRLTAEEAEQKEIELIKKFNTTDRRYGYNIDGGGSANKVVSSETRQKLRERATGVTPSEETRKKMSKSHKGEKCHFFGKHLSDEQKQNLREIKSKAVEKVDANGIVIAAFPSMKEAAESCGVTRQAISSCCYGKTKKCAGYKWRWKNGTPTEEH